MAIFQWQERFFIGVPQIDKHHLHLVDLLNSTYRDFLRNAPPEILAELFEELIDYATYHFSAEEQLMLESGFPGREKHQEKHTEFANHLTEMHENYLHKQKPFFLEILTFLQNWLETHILGSDGELGRFLAVNNKQPKREL
jgi:hemerythrin